MFGDTDDERLWRHQSMIQRISATNNNSSSIQYNNMPTSRPLPPPLTYYPRNTTQFNGRSTLSGIPEEGPSSASTQALSEISVFKMPNTISNHLQWSKVESSVNSFLNGYRSTDVPKAFLKLWVRASNEILLLAHRDAQGAFDEVAVLDKLYEELKNKYYYGRSRIGSQSDTSTFEFNPCGNVSSLLEGPQSSNQTSNLNPSLALDRTTASFYQPQTTVGAQSLQARLNPTVTLSRTQNYVQNGNISSVAHYDAVARPQSSGNQNLPTTKRTQPMKNNNSSQLAKKQNETLVQAAGGQRSRQNINVHRKVNQTLQVADTTLSGAKNVTRSGRQVKSPNQFWKGIEQQHKEPAFVNYSRSRNVFQENSPNKDLNETMTLRNKTVVRATPVAKKQVGRPRRTPLVVQSKENKENTNESVELKEKQQEKMQAKSKKVKKAPAKRKSKGPELTISKRKKVEECSLLEDSMNSDDELFEPLYFKRHQTVNKVLSPSTGLHSVKKAAAASTSKETPPAKFISQLMEPNPGTSSVAKELPESKASQVVKRVTKVAEKKAPIKVTKKAKPKRSNNKEQPIVGEILNNMIKTTYSTTPDRKILSVIRGTAVASDDEISDTDEDLF